VVLCREGEFGSDFKCAGRQAPLPPADAWAARLIPVRYRRFAGRLRALDSRAACFKTLDSFPGR